MGTLTVPLPENLVIKLLDENGEEVLLSKTILFDGQHTYFDNERIQSGIYHLSITADGFEDYKTTIILSPQNSYDGKWRISAVLRDENLRLTNPVELTVRNSRNELIDEGIKIGIRAKGRDVGKFLTIGINGICSPRLILIEGETYEIFNSFTLEVLTDFVAERSLAGIGLTIDNY